MAKTVAVFPNPYLKDEWSTVMHPLLSTWAGSLKQAGWNVIGLNADDIFNTDLLKNGKKEEQQYCINVRCLDSGLGFRFYCILYLL